MDGNPSTKKKEDEMLQPLQPDRYWAALHQESVGGVSGPEAALCDHYGLWW
jgi:hypothetical protein